MLRLVIAGCLSAMLLGRGSAFADDSPPLATPHITVTGASDTEARPDIAVLVLGVVSENPTAAEAQSDVAVSSTSVIAALKGFGVDPKDIQTSSLTLAPVMVEERDQGCSVLNTEPRV
jgi:uncharacterized protein YggE